MKTKILAVLAAVMASFGWRAYAQTYDTNNEVVQTFAGSGFSGYVDGVGQLTMFNNPNAIVADSHSNLFVWDSGNYRIRKIAPDGTVTTFAGGGSQTTGVGTNVNLGSSGGIFNITGLAIDRNNNLWLPTTGSSGFGGTGLYEITSGAVVTKTNYLGPVQFSGICADSLGNIYLSDGNGERIYQLQTNGFFGVFAGSGNGGYVDGNGIFTAFASPAALACDEANNIYVWDSGNSLIRRIDKSQNVTTFAGKYKSINVNADGVGTNASFGYIYQMCSDNVGNLYLACGAGRNTVGGEYPGSCIRKVTATTNVMTMAGSFKQTGYTNGAGNLASFNGTDGVCISGGTIFVADAGNQRIRQITFNPQPQVVTGANLGIGTFTGVTITGIVGRTYQIQSSPNMAAWTTGATVLLTSSPYLWIDQTPIAGNKFYQALLLP
jgi:hypothetical protein